MTGRRCVALLACAAALAMFAPSRGVADGEASGLLSLSLRACMQSLRLGEYDVRVWASVAEDVPNGCRLVTIERRGAVLACHDWATGLNRLSGIDVDGTGWPNVMVECYSGGAHCCFSTHVYDLADELAPIALPPSPGGNAVAEFVDVDGDGIYEVITADDSFAYAYCAFAGSPSVRVILEYDRAARRYVPAGPAHRGLYDADIQRDTARAADAGPADAGWDGTPKCAVLPLVLDYLYAGEADAAWDALARYYDAPDREAFRAEIETVVGASPYYAAPSR